MEPQRYAARMQDEMIREVEGVADSMTGAMAWDREAEGYSPRANHAVYTFRRKTEEPCQVGR